MPSFINLLSFVLALSLSAVLSRLCIPLAHRLRMVDYPGNRKIHSRSVAYLGGAALFVSLVLILLAPAPFLKTAWGPRGALWACLIPAVAASALGLADDIFDLSARLKFLLQACIAFGFTFFAFRLEVMHLPGLKPFALGWFSVPLTSFFIMAIANGMNMIDGSDGLCVSSATVSLALCAVAATINGQDDLVLMSLTACGACLGFLVWNRPPARIFLGDAGSQGLGFLLACTLVALGQPAMHLPAFYTGGQAAQPFHYQAALVVLVAGFPAYEVTLSVLRRGLQGRSLFRGDQGHLHHRLLNLGLTAGWISRIAAMFTLLSGGIAVAFMLDEKGVATVLLANLVGLLGLSMSQLGYTRFFQLRWLNERRPHFAVVHHFAAMQSAKLLLARERGEILELVVQACHELGAHECRITLPDMDEAGGRWTWVWVDPSGAHGHDSSVDRVRLTGIKAHASWILETEGSEPDLDMNLRVVMAEFMRSALESLNRIVQGKVRLKVVEGAVKERIPAGPLSVRELKRRI